MSMQISVRANVQHITRDLFQLQCYINDGYANAFTRMLSCNFDCRMVNAYLLAGIIRNTLNIYFTARCFFAYHVYHMT